jgi:hypothetical protein
MSDEEKVFTTAMEGVWAIQEPTNPYAGFAVLAKRLGVKPVPRSSASILFEVDNEFYDFFEIMNAFLDKIDKTLDAIG